MIETDARAADGDRKHDVHLFRLQVDVLDEKGEQISFANSRPRRHVATFWLHPRRAWRINTPTHCCKLDILGQVFT